MRRFLSIFGAAMLAVLLAVGVATGIRYYDARTLDAESRAFVDQAVPAIARHWDEGELLARASPELKRSTGPAEIARAFGGLAVLGPFLVYEGATGRARTSYLDALDRLVVAAYVAKARFRHGAALFQVVLVKRGERWMIREFQVQPLVLAPGDGTRELKT